MGAAGKDSGCNSMRRQDGTTGEKCNRNIAHDV